MKHTTPYPQIQQSLVSILLAAGLIVSYNLNITLAASPSTRAGEHGTSSCSPGIPAAAMGTSELTLTAQGGHQVIVQQNNGSWQAKVHENLPRIGFCRTLDHLPVYIEEGLNWQRIAKLSEATQRQYVAVDFTLKKSETPAESETPYVYIGRRDFTGASLQSLHEAVNQGYLSQVRKILNTEGIDINAVDAQGQSALHRAVIKGHTEIAALLLEAGADTTLQDHQGQTALGCANEDDDNRYLSAIATVLQLLSTLDDLIKANLAGKAQNKDEIEQTESAICKWLSKLKSRETQTLGHSQGHYQDFTYRCNMLLYSYYKAIGETLEAEDYKKIAEEHKKIDTTGLATIAPDADEVKALAAKITATIARSGGANASIEDDEIQKILTKLKATDIIDDKAYEIIESHFVQACQEPTSFADYVGLIAIRKNFKRIVQDAIVSLGDAQKAEEEPSSSTSQEDHNKKQKR